ncbi:hypothetical protein KDAU_55270 [Dictyobacter aurantiacus]|uniref:Uncharacterized protein n=1 Tax=Dictyobacter aurantiacus TaxID=1936993 RepID=A0A401ZMV6_9CHLR|nr:hypothetical protein KDAU_55270 [Dictyobacter aurantiacus]
MPHPFTYDTAPKKREKRSYDHAEANGSYANFFIDFSCFDTNLGTKLLRGAEPAGNRGSRGEPGTYEVDGVGFWR